jgi:hypothetical protein
MKAQGQIDLATADSLIGDQRVVLNAMVDEAKLIAAQGDPTVPQQIIISGGLPVLPGCENLIMPDQEQLNGHRSLELTAQPVPAQGPPPAHPDDKSKSRD